MCGVLHSMCYVGGYSLGLARGSYCDHNVVGAIWEIDGCWAKQFGSGQSSVADTADRSGLDRDLGLFGIRLVGFSDREWHQFAIFLSSTIDQGQRFFFGHILVELLSLLIRSETSLRVDTKIQYMQHRCQILIHLNYHKSSPASLSGMPTRLHLRAILP